MVDPINFNSLASQSAFEATSVSQHKHTLVNSDFEATLSKSSELNNHVEQLKSTGFIDEDRIRLASDEAREIFFQNQQPEGNELNGYNTVLHNNRAKIDALKAELEKIARPEEKSQVGSYVESIDKEMASLESVISKVDLNEKGYDAMDVIKLQTKMYNVTEHVEIFSKVVDQIASGLKTILQQNI